MFEDLLKAKTRYYAQHSIYPTAVKMTKATGNSLHQQAKVIKLGISEGYRAGYATNGMRIFIDEDQKAKFVFGFHHEGKFNKAPF